MPKLQYAEFPHYIPTAILMDHLLLVYHGKVVNMAYKMGMSPGSFGNSKLLNIS